MTGKTLTAAATRPLAGGPSITRTVAVLGIGLLFAAAVLVAAVGLGSVAIAPEEILRVIWQRIAGGEAGAATFSQTIILDLRLPRVLTAMLVGGGLALAGTVFQALLRNPLADPYIIGTAAGASLGAVTGLMLPMAVPALALGAASSWLGLGIVQILAFAGGLAAVLVVYTIARTGGRVPVVTLLLTGYAVSAMLAAGVALLMFLSGDRLAAIFSWLMGSLAAASWPRLAVAAPLVLVALGLLLLRWRRLNVLLLGDEPAAHLGLDVERERRTLTMLATLCASAVVAISGTIGFVGLVVPHLLRLAIGPDHRLLLPGSVVYGGSLLALADLAARLAGGVPVGIVTALLGAPFFLWLLRRSRSATYRSAR